MEIGSINKKEIDRIITMISQSDSPVRLLPIGTDKTMVTSHDDNHIANVIFPIGLDAPFYILKEKLDHLKVLKKNMGTKEEISLSHIRDDFGCQPTEAQRNTDAAMAMVFDSPLVHQFQMDWKVLEKLVKSMKVKSTIVSVKVHEGDKIVISNEEGDVGCMGLYKTH